MHMTKKKTKKKLMKRKNEKQTLPAFQTPPSNMACVRMRMRVCVCMRARVKH